MEKILKFAEVVMACACPFLASVGFGGSSMWVFVLGHVLLFVGVTLELVGKWRGRSISSGEFGVAWGAFVVMYLVALTHVTGAPVIVGVLGILCCVAWWWRYGRRSGAGSSAGDV